MTTIRLLIRLFMLALLVSGCSSGVDSSDIKFTDLATDQLSEITSSPDLSPSDTSPSCNEWQDGYSNFSEDDFALAEDYCQYLVACKFLALATFDMNCCAAAMFEDMLGPAMVFDVEMLHLMNCNVNGFKAFYGTAQSCTQPREQCGEPQLP
jgi:hypothetical protein